MFFAGRPSQKVIEQFLDESQRLPLSYDPVGIAETGKAGYTLDLTTVRIGRGQDDFDRARAALSAWKHFDVGWTEVFPRDASIAVGTVVVVLIRHLGFWSLNGARVVYSVGAVDRQQRFGFAYGTLANHAESGEEIFEVFIDPGTGTVNYRLRAVSRPRAALARAGKPVVRLLQAQFRRHSAAAMTRAVRV